MNGIIRVTGIVALIMAAALSLGLTACDGDGGEAPETASPEGGVTASATEEATPASDPTPTPVPETSACAADSTKQFSDAQEQVTWAVFCPTFLPEGFELEELRVYFPEAAVDGGGPPSDEPQGSVDATFVNQQGASVGLYQGNLAASLPGVDLIPRFAAGEGISPETTAFGELDGTLYAPLTSIQDVDLAAYVVVVAAEGPPPSYVLQTSEVDVDAVKEIAAAMRPVDAPAASSPP